MKAFTGVPAVLLTSATAGITIGIFDRESRPVWLLVVCATLLPMLAAVNTVRKGSRLEGREGWAWYVLALAMTLMIPIYAAEYLGARSLEDVLIASAYAAGAIAIMLVPLPNAGPYQRTVATLDAVGVGIVVATGTFWLASGSEIDIAGHTLWAMSDAAIMAMVGYVALRRSQRRGIDWALLWVICGIGAYLVGLLTSVISEVDYFIGHPSDIAYFVGMASFALSPLVKERRQELSQNILKPVRWGHVLAPYLLVAVLAAALFVYQINLWEQDPTGAVIVLGSVAVMLLALARQLAMIAEQRRKIELEQNGVIATISHELRTPLTAVVGFLDLLEDWELYSDDEKIEMMAIMRDQSHVLARVIGDLVDVARHRIESLDVDRTELEVKEFLISVIERVPELAKSTVHIDIANGTTLIADRERMFQIVSNYLSNAAQYGFERVEVVAFEEAGETVIEVHDDGPGVPDLYRAVIWERFERGSHRQSAIPGSGIGLSIARGVARSHGGETHYRRSVRLGGACFSVRIPFDRSLLWRPDSDEPAASA